MSAKTNGSNGQTQRLSIFMIKPSKYDDAGYVIRYFRGVLPSNTLACLYGLTEDVSRRKLLGNVRLDVELIDETTHRVPVDRIRKAARNRHTKAVVCLAGVQTNQFPRAYDLAMQFRDAGVTVLIGGFHVSGILSMFAAIPDDIQRLLDAGVTIVKGEVEEHWHEMLQDICQDELKPIYDFIHEMPDLNGAALPMVNKRYLRRFVYPNFGTMDCSRGCPFNCSFCTIINVQGRTMRYRDARKIGDTLRSNYASGIDYYFFTDDNFARNKNWEAIFDEIIRLRHEESIRIRFMMQVDVLSYRINNFVAKAKEAGCTQVFIGMESTNPVNLQAAGKGQNHVEDYVQLISAWHRSGVGTHVGFIIGFPADTEESVRQDLDRLMHQIKVDQASFFMLMPLPGSMDHKKLVEAGAYLDPDYNTYDSRHETTRHPALISGAWKKLYDESWRRFYSLDNMKAILRRAYPDTYWSIFRNFLWYKNAALIEGEHPMVAGFLRLKDRTTRRPGYAVSGRWEHFVMRIREVGHYLKLAAGLALEMQELWLQTRIQSGFEVRLVRDMGSLKAGWKKTLTILEWRGSVMRRMWTNAWGRVNVFGLGKLRTRNEISSFWSRTYVSFKRGQWHRIALHRLPGNLLRECKLGLHFVLSAFCGTRPRLDFVRYKKRRTKPLTVSVSLPDRMREVRNTLEVFLGELNVQVVSAGHSLEVLLERGQEGLHDQVHEAEESVRSYLVGLKGKADFVLLPIVEGVDHYHERFLEAVDRLASRSVKNLPSIVHVPLLRISSIELRESLHQLGLLFTDDVLRVQSACEKALPSMTLQPG